MNKYGVFVFDYDGNEELMDLRYIVNTQEEAEKYAQTLEASDIAYLKGEGILAYVEVYAVDENDEKVGEAVYSSKEDVSQEEAERAHVGEESIEEFYPLDAKKKKDKKEEKKKVEAREKNFLPEGSEVICNECKLTWTGKSWKLAGATDEAKFMFNGEEVAFDFEGEPYIMGELPEQTKPLNDVPEGAEGGEAPPVEGIPPATTTAPVEAPHEENPPAEA